MTWAKIRCHPSARTAPASTVDALHNFALLQFSFGYSADAVGAEVCVPRLNAAKAAEVFVALLLPLCHQVPVSKALLDAVLEQLFADGFPLMEQVEDVSRLLVMDLEDGPQRLDLTFSLV